MTVDVLDAIGRNYAYVVARLDELYLHARLALGRGDPLTEEELAVVQERADLLAGETAGPDSMTRLAVELDLGEFEQRVVLLCLGYELDGRFAALERECTVGLALRALPGANWPAFDESSALRRWELVRVEEGLPLVHARLRLGPDVRQLLIGEGIARPGHVVDVPPLPDLVLRSTAAAARSVALRVHAAARLGERPVVELHGADREERLSVAQLWAAAEGRRLARVDVRDLPEPSEELESSLRYWDRNARLIGASMLVECHEHGVPLDETRVRRAAAVLTCPLAVSGPVGVAAGAAARLVRHECSWPDATERLEAWQRFTAAAAPVRGAARRRARDRLLATLAERYRIGARAIEAICAEALAAIDDAAEPEAGHGSNGQADRRDETALLARALNAACRRHVGAALEHLADRVATGEPEELVLPAEQSAELEEIVARIEDSYQVNVRWGMGFGRVQGVSALFAGPSGTGKTLAARTIARRTALDLYRVDLSSTLSKYVGETEKNIREVFEAADAGGAILLFDEADALFGKRGEVKDSHDRYANIGVAYLLQKMEDARCPCLLTTNFREALDPAFTRRLGAIVEFPFPDEESRRRIWERAFAPEAPTARLRPDRLASLVVNGGTIRNIALRAAFLAAMEGEPVEMRHVREAAGRELRKAGRDLPIEEVAGWG